MAMRFMTQRVVTGFIVLLVGWVIVSASQSVGQPPQSGTQWEYRIAICSFVVHEFNAIGRDGWELVTISENAPNSGYVAVYKRPRQ
jgi:hypothetical protein